MLAPYEHTGRRNGSAVRQGFVDKTRSWIRKNSGGEGRNPPEFLRIQLQIHSCVRARGRIGIALCLIHFSHNDAIALNFDNTDLSAVIDVGPVCDDVQIPVAKTGLAGGTQRR